MEWSGAYDLNGEIAGYSAIWNKESSSIPPAEISTTDSNLSFTVDETGEYYVHIRAVDSTGYWNNSVYTIGPFKIDLTNPEVSIDIPSNYQYFNTDTITVSWGGSDDHSGVDYYELYVYDADGNYKHELPKGKKVSQELRNEFNKIIIKIRNSGFNRISHCHFISLS